MSFSRFKKMTRTTLAGFMAVWLSGVVFLFCCGTMDAMAADSDICPLAKMSADCDKAEKAGANAAIVVSSDESSVGCCAFLPAVFDKSRKVERDQKQIALASTSVVIEPQLPKVAAPHRIPTTFRPHIPDRQRSFVKNCAFLI